MLGELAILALPWNFRSHADEKSKPPKARELELQLESVELEITMFTYDGFSYMGSLLNSLCSLGIFMKSFNNLYEKRMPKIKIW